MTELKHTPKPWEWTDVVGAGIQISAVIPKGETRKVHSYRDRTDTSEKGMLFTLREDHAFQIADARWVQFSSEEWDEMQRDNAKLIAAAPDMYEFVQACANLIADNHDPNTFKALLEEVSDEAYTLLKKIEGEVK